MSKINILSDKETKKNGRLKSQDLFEKETMWKLILKMAVPTVLMFVALALYTTIDTLLATKLIGASGIYDDLNPNGGSDAVLSIIGWTSNITAIAMASVVIFNTGAEVIYANKISKGEYKESREVLSSTFITSLIFSVLLSLVVASFAPTIIENLAGSNQSEGAKEQAILYIRLQMIFIPFISIYDLLVRVFRVEGKLKAAALVGIIGIPINLTFDWILMGPCKLGLSGAAVASIIGFGTSLFLGLILAAKFRKANESNLFYSWSTFRFKKIVFVATLGIGLPFVFRSVFMSINNANFIGSINELGSFDYKEFLSSSEIIDFDQGLTSSTNSDEFYESFWSTTAGVFQQTYIISWYCVLGLIQGTSSVVAYNYGSKNYDRAKSATLWIFIYMIIMSVFTLIIFILITPQLMNLFSATYINSVSTSFIRKSLIRIVTLGLSFVPFAYLLNTRQQWKTYVITFLQVIIFIIFLSVFDNKNLGTNSEYFNLLAFVPLMADSVLLLIIFPYFLYKLKHIHRDGIFQVEKENLKDRKKLMKKNISEQQIYYEKRLKEDTIDIKIEILARKKLPNLFLKLLTIKMNRVIVKNNEKSSFYSATYKNRYIESKKLLKKKVDNEKNKYETEKKNYEKSYSELLNSFKLREYFFFKYCYDYQNSYERDLKFGVTIINKVKQKNSEEKIEKKQNHLTLSYADKIIEGIKFDYNEKIKKINLKYYIFLKKNEYLVKFSSNNSKIEKLKIKHEKINQKKEKKLKNLDKKLETKLESINDKNSQ